MMSASNAVLDLDELKLLLLDLLSPVRAVEQARIDCLDENEWKVLQEMVRQHRLGPLLHWQLRETHTHLQVPDALSEMLAQHFRTAATLSLQFARELLLTHKVLARSGISYVALKGAYLAPYAYPHPALRPLRDLDILVHRDTVLKVYQVLIDGGLSRIGKVGYSGDPAAMIDYSHHLPPVRSPSGTLIVELHPRLFHLPQHGLDVPDLSDDPEFWERCVKRATAGENISYESAEDLLIHLIVHSAYDHEFDNGPLILSDIAFLLQTHDVNWPFFWSLADRLNCVPGCRLVLTLVESYWNPGNIEWCGQEPSVVDTNMQAQCTNAAKLMLRNFTARKDVMLGLHVASCKTLREKLGYICGKLFPSRRRIEALYPITAGSSKTYLLYPVNWLRLAREQLPPLWRSMFDKSARGEAMEVERLRQWLSTTPPSN